MRNIGASRRGSWPRTLEGDDWAPNYPEIPLTAAEHRPPTQPAGNPISMGPKNGNRAVLAACSDSRVFPRSRSPQKLGQIHPLPSLRRPAPAKKRAAADRPVISDADHAATLHVLATTIHAAGPAAERGLGWSLRAGPWRSVAVMPLALCPQALPVAAPVGASGLPAFVSRRARRQPRRERDRRRTPERRR